MPKACVQVLVFGLRMCWQTDLWMDVDVAGHCGAQASLRGCTGAWFVNGFVCKFMSTLKRRRIGAQVRALSKKELLLKECMVRGF